MDSYELLTTYAWHRPDNIPDTDATSGCERWFDKVPTTASQWLRVPKKCACGFYQALHAARGNA